MATSLRRKARTALAPVLGRLNVRGARHRHRFAPGAPNAQDTVDIFAGQWVTAFPPELGVVAGQVNHFDPDVDPRVPWVQSQLPDGLAGMRVLELGPFEGYQTAVLEWAGASVVAVEGSETAYLKCLVVKELLDLRAHFLYGDMLEYLEASDETFDIVWASGILYHQTDPIGLLERIAAKSGRVFLHTHYFDADQLPAEVRESRFDAKRDVIVEWHGRAIRLHCYDYAADPTTNGFAGGPRPFALWMEREDIEFVLAELGLSEITYGVVDPTNPAGPGFFLLATTPSG